MLLHSCYFNAIACFLYMQITCVYKNVCVLAQEKAGLISLKIQKAKSP